LGFAKTRTKESLCFRSDVWLTFNIYTVFIVPLDSLSQLSQKTKGYTTRVPWDDELSTQVQQALNIVSKAS
jgi:hypothetical protein